MVRTTHSRSPLWSSPRRPLINGTTLRWCRKIQKHFFGDVANLATPKLVRTGRVHAQDKVHRPSAVGLGGLADVGQDAMSALLEDR